ncbi:helix-turn-helix domain-containing protein [Acidipila sp. EB88]|uniref:AraC family transcriptional regulator n=1 Tax=Acidipila sp. EB88 TaxID=2305226 RepID=UPI000F5F9E0D|nr:AraC family transcriptional regulator [Acidipila sp. EB88]
MADLSLDLSLFESPGRPRLFAIAGSQANELSSGPHQHGQGQLLGSMSGLLSVDVESKVWIVPAIHAVWLPPGTLHAVHSHGPFNGWAVFIEESSCDSLPQGTCTIRVSGLLREAVLRAATWPRGSHDTQSETIASAIIDEIRTLPLEFFGLPLPSDERLMRIAQAFIADPSNERGLRDWARFAAVSSRTISRRFVTQTGFTFTAWRQRARLLRSLEMLASGMPVTEVAANLDYSTTSAFITLFRRTFGETPSKHRSIVKP